MIATKEDLALTIDETEWSWLRPQLEQGGLILVNDSLDLAEAALKHTSTGPEETASTYIVLSAAYEHAGNTAAAAAALNTARELSPNDPRLQRLAK